MEPGARKILPRLRPTSSGHGDGELAPESARSREDGGSVVISNGADGKYKLSLKGLRPLPDEGPPRKRQNVSDIRAPSQSLPSVQQLLVQNDPAQVEAQMSLPCRLVRNPQNGLYYSHGAFIFKSPSPPGYDFPRSLSHDARPFSFASVEPELMDVFKHAWYLRQYVRLQRYQAASSTEMWWDHKMMNDCYGIDNVLHTWSSRYEPGTGQYPASMLYKTVLWLYFNRSIQPSISTTSFRDVVDDGLHHLQVLDRAMGPGSADRSFLLVPIFLLGATAFDRQQRSAIWRALERADPGYQSGAAAHAMFILQRVWDMMDDSNSGATWDWERLQDPVSAQNVQISDRSLVDLLRDPFEPQYQSVRPPSPEAQPEFDTSRFRAAPMPNQAPVPPMPEGALNTRNSSGDTGRQTPSQGVSPTDISRSAVLAEGSGSQYGDPRPERNLSQPELAPAPAQPRPFLAPPPPGPSNVVMTKDELFNQIRSFTRKVPQIVKSKSSVPPCHVCGKELKNPSDAQKHQLQHSKPFVCKEPGCTRILGFATENDLQRHRKSVHGASPRIGNKIGYVCVECPEPSDGTQRKWWPRLDNFKAHIRRKHHGADEEALIQASSTPRRQEDTFTDAGYTPGSGDTYTPTQSQYATPSDRPRHHLYTASQSSNLHEQPTQERQIQQGLGAGPADGDDDDGEEADDGPVGPWELHRSFRANRKRALDEDDEGESPAMEGEDGDEDDSPMTAQERSRTASKQDPQIGAVVEQAGMTPRASTAGDAADESKQDGEEMDVYCQDVKDEEKE